MSDKKRCGECDAPITRLVLQTWGAGKAAGMQVSVIISTYDSPAWLEKVLWGYAIQTHRDFEILVADDGSDQQTAVLIQRMQRATGLVIRHIVFLVDGVDELTVFGRNVLENAKGVKTLRGPPILTRELSHRWRRLGTLHRRGFEDQLGFEEAFSKGIREVMHQIFEHRVRVLLVLDERVLLAPRPIMNRRAQLIEIIQVVLPLFVDHVERDERQQSIGEALSALVGDRVQAVELVVERRTAGLEDDLLRLLN